MQSNGKSINLQNNFIFSSLELKTIDMQFLLIAYDGTDPGALKRRMEVREDHFARINMLKKEGEFLFGGAILDETGKMIGSMIVYDLPDRQTLDERLKEEPYITRGVWENTEIRPFRLAKFE